MCICFDVRHIHYMEMKLEKGQTFSVHIRSFDDQLMSELNLLYNTVRHASNLITHSLLFLTSPSSHPLLPPPLLSPCLTLTVIQSWHLLPEPPPSCLSTLFHPLQLHISRYSAYICVLLLFLFSVYMLRLCLVSYHVVYLIGQVTPQSL